MSAVAPSVDEIVLLPIEWDQQAEADDAASQPSRAFPMELQRRVESAIRRIDEPAIRETAGGVLDQVLRLLDWLKRIDDNLHKLDTLQESLSLLELVHFEARSLVEYLKQ